MKEKLFAAGLLAGLALAPTTEAAPASLRMLTQNNYLPGLPVLVRVEGYAPDGSRDHEMWDIDATLTADGGVTLSTNKNHTLTIESNTLVLIDGVGSGTAAADIFVQANASIQSLGKELHPVTITCSNLFFTNLRRAFSVTNAAAYTNLAIRMIRDDAGVVYVRVYDLVEKPASNAR